MIFKVYIIILSYFLAGIIGFYFINRKIEPVAAHKSWKKTLIYFLIINIVCLSIVIDPVVFKWFSVVIIVMGFYELFYLFYDSGYHHKTLFYCSTAVFMILALAFLYFSRFEKGLIFYSFAVLSIFDSFSEITGRLWGRKKIFPSISPNKTVTGFLGGLLIGLLSGILFKGLIKMSLPATLILAGGIAVFAFLGDLSASYYKRRFNVKDFSNLIPEHGGFLDRFDSLIAGGAWVAFFSMTGIFGY